MDFRVEYYEPTAGIAVDGKPGTTYVCKHETLTADSMADAAQKAEERLGRFIKSIQWEGNYLPKEAGY